MFQATGLRHVRCTRRHHTDLVGNLTADQMDHQMVCRMGKLPLNQSKSRLVLFALDSSKNAAQKESQG